ncbi:MAG: M14 family zinc carboxypeptidase [Promethearchaeota archaeon]
MNEESNQGFEFPEKYHTHQELNNELKKLCNQYPDLVTQHKLGISTEEKDILGFIINSKQKNLKDKPTSIIIGCHHGRECITSEAAYYSMNYLLKNYSENKQIYEWIDKSAIIYIPMLNPDGHDIVIRKNGNRVDLNRNYTFNWGHVPGCSHDPKSQIYCGPTKLSEIESQLVNKMKIIDDLFEKFKNIKSSLDIHSGADIVMYPWG